MTREYAIRRLKVLTDYEYDEDLEALEMAIQALKQQPCDDCISRAEVIKETKTLLRGNYDPEYIIETLKTLPSVQPTRPKGRWIADVDRWGDIVTTVNGYRCSECCAFNTDKDNYCPNCGAEMTESEDKEAEA